MNLSKIVFFILVMLCSPAYADSMEGIANIIDGDTITINEAKFRLVAVDTPERKQTCNNAPGDLFYCGEYVKNELEKFINGQKVKCIYDYTDFYGRYLAECFINDISLNQWLLKSGYAYYYRHKAYKGFKSLQEEAERNKTGLFKYEFINPKEFRKMKKR